MNIDSPHKVEFVALRQLWKQAFSDTDAFLDSFFQTAFSTERCRLVRVDGTVAAALYWFDCEYRNRRVAYLYAVATDKAYRGRGICHELMKDTHRHLAARGYEGVILVPSSKALFDFYGRMGYRICSSIRECTCLGVARDTISFHSIDKDEYASIRRMMLPAGGVIQENENLDFLKTHARLYSGEGFLLAASERDGQLFGVEVLGDMTKLPGVVHTLGYEKGIFRMPGDERPFAMYRSLKDSPIPSPDYFGLAFDI